VVSCDYTEYRLAESASFGFSGGDLLQGVMCSFNIANISMKIIYYKM
jgi:hypothetical protein